MIWFEFGLSFSFSTSKFIHRFLLLSHYFGSFSLGEWYSCFIFHSWLNIRFHNSLTELTYTQHTHNYIRLSVTLKQEIKYVAKKKREFYRASASKCQFFTNDFRCVKLKLHHFFFVLLKNGELDWVSSDWDMAKFEWLNSKQTTKLAGQWFGPIGHLSKCNSCITLF